MAVQKLPLPKKLILLGKYTQRNTTLIWNLELEHRNWNTMNWNLTSEHLGIKAPFIRRRIQR